MTRRYDGGVVVGEIDPPTGTIKDWLEERLKGCQERFDKAEKDPITPNNLAHRSGLVGSISVCREALYHIERIEKWQELSGTACLVGTGPT